MDCQGLMTLHDYNAYANNLVLDVVARVPEDDLTRETSPSHGSVRKLLCHMLTSEAFFLRSVQERVLELPDLFQMSDLRPYWQNLAMEIHTTLSTMQERDLHHKVPVRIRDRVFRLPVWQLFTQSALHSTHHRGELSILLTQLGFPLPTLDPIIQFAETSGQPWPWK